MSEAGRAACTVHDENSSIYAGPSRDVTAGSRFEAAFPLVMGERPSAILDIGCGRGYFLRRIPATVRRSGIDTLPAQEAPPDIEYIRHDIAQGLPWDAEHFDVVFAGEVIEHLLDTAGFLAECRRVLRPNGVLVLTTPNLAYWRNLLQWVRRQQFFFVDHRAGETGHVRYFAPRTLQALLVETGFRVERLFSVGDLPTSTNALLRGVGNLVGRLFPLRNLSLVAKARRTPAASPAVCPSTGELPEDANSP